MAVKPRNAHRANDWYLLQRSFALQGTSSTTTSIYVALFECQSPESLSYVRSYRVTSWHSSWSVLSLSHTTHCSVSQCLKMNVYQPQAGCANMEADYDDECSQKQGFCHPVSEHDHRSHHNVGHAVFTCIVLRVYGLRTRPLSKAFPALSRSMSLDQSSATAHYMQRVLKKCSDVSMRVDRPMS